MICHCGDPFIYKRRPKGCLIHPLMLSYACSRFRPEAILLGKRVVLTAIFPPSIHQSRSRVLRLTAGRTWVKTSHVISTMLFHAPLLFVQRAIPPSNQQGTVGPIGGHGFPRQVVSQLLVSSFNSLSSSRQDLGSSRCPQDGLAHYLP